MKGLLEAITADPSDDAPRRVLADALLDRSEPFGELIHIQLDLAATGLTRKQRITRLRRERELFRVHRDRWIAPLSGVIDRATFRRGFIDEAIVHADMLARGDVFTLAPMLRALVLTTWGSDGSTSDMITRFRNTLALPFVARLEGLRYFVSTTEESFEGDAMRALEEALLRMPRLRAVIADGSSYAARGVLCQVDRFDFRAFSWPRAHLAIEELPPNQLRSVELPIPERNDNIAALLELPALAAMEELTISIPEPKPGIELLRHPALSKLRRLELDASGEVGSELANAHLPRLVELDLHKSSPTLVASRFFERVDATRLPALRVLRVEQLDRGSARQLVASPLAKHLEVLDLRGSPAANAIRDELVRAFGGLLLVSTTRWRARTVYGSAR